MRYAGENDFNLRQYMVELDKPVGLTLAPDPVTGAIVVQNIKEGSPAALSQLIQVGDTVKKCSAVFGEEMWQALDIRRVRWAINNRMSKVKLVLERPIRPLATPPAWYGLGRTGQASSWPHGPEREALTSPISFSASASLDDAGLDHMSCPGKPLMVGFHRSGVLSPPSLSSPSSSSASASALSRRPPRASLSVAARSEKLQLLREEISMGGRKNMIHLIHEPPFTASSARGGLSDPYSSPDGASSRSPAEQPCGPFSSFSQQQQQPPPPPNASAKKNKMVLPFLPWLLVTSTRLDTRDLTLLASIRGLSALLELSLTSSPASGGHLEVKGSSKESAPRNEFNVSSLLSVSSSKSSPSGPPSSSNSPNNSSSPSPFQVVQSFLGSLSMTQQQPQQAPVNGTVASQGRNLLPFGLGGGGADVATKAGEREKRLRQLVTAAASLQRLCYRRMGSSLHNSPRDRCAILLHADEGVESEVGGLLAGWLYWYQGLGLQEAILTTELGTGAAVKQDLIEEATHLLFTMGQERQGRATLNWRGYGAQEVSVAGDLVGGWENHVSLLKCDDPEGCRGETCHGHFFLTLTGLKPGVYYYKFIVDGTWAVDPVAPKVIDSAGNYNNVLNVPSLPAAITSKERLQLVRWQAANMALELKIRGGSS